MRQLFADCWRKKNEPDPPVQEWSGSPLSLFFSLARRGTQKGASSFSAAIKQNGQGNIRRIRACTTLSFLFFTYLFLIFLSLFFYLNAAGGCQCHGNIGVGLFGGWSGGAGVGTIYESEPILALKRSSCACLFDVLAGGKVVIVISVSNAWNIQLDAYIIHNAEILKRLCLIVSSVLSRARVRVITKFESGVLSQDRARSSFCFRCLTIFVV